MAIYAIPGVLWSLWQICLIISTSNFLIINIVSILNKLNEGLMRNEGKLLVWTLVKWLWYQDKRSINLHIDPAKPGSKSIFLPRVVLLSPTSAVNLKYQYIIHLMFVIFNRSVIYITSVYKLVIVGLYIYVNINTCHNFNPDQRGL